MQFSKLFLSAVALLATTAVSAEDVPVPYTLCGDDKLGLEGVTASEYPVKKGDTVSANVIFTPKEDITGGTLNVQIKKGAIPLYKDSVDICKDLGQTCPLPAGKQVTASVTQQIPSETPAGKFTTHIVISDESGNQLSCIDSTLEVDKVTYGKSDEEMAISGALVGHINMVQSSWESHISPRFANATIGQLKRMMGTVMRGHPSYLPLEYREDHNIQEGDIPDTFDSRDYFSDCTDVIGHVRDQSACGSCWAFATTEALNDRLCISQGVHDLLSPTDTVACCSGMRCGMSMGCNGGQPSGAWTWFTKTGVVTGGDQVNEGDGSTCEPYPFESCAHHVDPTPEHPACPSKDYSTPKCTSSCTDNAYATSYKDDKHFAKSSYGVRGVEQIQAEILKNGPVSCAFTVYEDFPTYKSGVYTHTSGSALGGHAVKMIGWGTENGEDYWLIVNSWNDSWGNGGTFKIKRGVNECGIEGQITAGEV